MKNYYYDNHALANDKLAVYVLLTENDYDDECYREIHGISYDLDCIEKIIDEISSNSEFDDNTRYIVHRIKQMKDELFQSEFQLSDSVRKECYIVFRGPVLETTEELLGYFKDRQDAVYYAGIASSFEDTDDIIIIKAPMDTYFDFTNVESASAEDGFEFE